MNKLILLTLVCTVISTGWLEEIGPKFYSPSLSPNGDAQVWPLTQEQQKKPCPKKNGKNDKEDQWIPSYSSKVTHRLSPESLLQPLALKNEDYLKESNPDINVDLSQPGVPERRSFNAAYFKPPQEEEDCEEEPSQISSASAGAAAIKLIKSCLKNKQLSGSSRRSMSDGVDSDEIPASDEIESQESDTDFASRKAGYRIRTEIRSKDTLLNPRVCYACSTATNPSCWEPDRRTTVKYCAKEKSCVTKSFGTTTALTLIRDCADSCEDSSVPGIEPKFNKCKVCHSDLCNGAFSVNVYNLAIILTISIVKYTFY